MATTVLITGTSTGIGREAVLRFARAGWNVVASLILAAVAFRGALRRD